MRWRLIFYVSILVTCQFELAHAQEPLTAERVISSIERGVSYLKSQQKPDGTWSSPEVGRYQVGMTSLVLLALMNSGLPPDDPAVARGLKWLRNRKEEEVTFVYDISCMMMALAAARAGSEDNFRMVRLARKLSEGQIKLGQFAGGWDYTYKQQGVGSPDRSNSQFAILALRDAAYAGIPIERSLWVRARQYWMKSQNPDGGWGYRNPGDPSKGSMTVAGTASLAITSRFLQDRDETDAQGNPLCCQPPEVDEELDRAFGWMKRNFSVHHNPKSNGWWLYYLYGLERAGRLNGRRFFGTHDWYREGARVLLDRQNRRDGSWKGTGGFEDEPIVGSSLALLFLSKGLSPVLVNKMKIGPRDPLNPDQVLGEIWNQHPQDVWNLVEHIATLPKWPKLMTWQSFDLDKAAEQQSLQEMLQAPILFVSMEQDLNTLMQEDHINLLREYLYQGGFLFCANACQSRNFENGLYELVQRLYPQGEAQLEPLEPTHPIYRSEYLLDSKTVPLHGVDVGCRTAIVYSPEDLSCLWDKRSVVDVPGRSQDLKTAIARALRIGVNVIAYVTGREPPNKLDERAVDRDSNEEGLRGVLSIAKLRHSGDWDAAPHAVKNLLKSLEEAFGVVSGSRPEKIPASDQKLYRHTLLYLHGQRPFEFAPSELENIRTYLDNGGVLFADACCGSRLFDRSFRKTIKLLYPDHELDRIPVDHEMFHESIGYDLERVKRRVPAGTEGEGVLQNREMIGPPYFEGIKIGDRYAVIYSKYDISCALEKQTSLACIGYTPEDAAKLAINVVLYSVLQDLTTGIPAQN